MVGTSHRIPTRIRNTSTGAFVTVRRALDALSSRTTGGRAAPNRGGGHQASLLKRRMFSARTGITSTKEHCDRRAEPEVPYAAERRPPHRERDHVRLVLYGAGSDREDDVERLEDVDDHGDEHDHEHGSEQGAVTRRKTCHSLAPSIRAASRRSRGIQAGREDDHREPGPDPDVGDEHRRQDDVRRAMRCHRTAPRTCPRRPRGGSRRARARRRRTSRRSPWSTRRPRPGFAVLDDRARSRPPPPRPRPARRRPVGSPATRRR